MLCFYEFAQDSAAVAQGTTHFLEVLLYLRKGYLKNVFSEEKTKSSRAAVLQCSER